MGSIQCGVMGHTYHYFEHPVAQVFFRSNFTFWVAGFSRCCF